MAMIIACEECGNEIKKNQESASCDPCQGYVHADCMEDHLNGHKDDDDVIFSLSED